MTTHRPWTQGLTARTPIRPDRRATSIRVTESERWVIPELARVNHAVRPGGEAKVKLAQALVRADQMDEARRVITDAVDSGYSTPALHATAYWIYLRANDPRASTEAGKARALAPDAIERLSWMR